MARIRARKTQEAHAALEQRCCIIIADVKRREQTDEKVHKLGIPVDTFFPVVPPHSRDAFLRDVADAQRRVCGDIQTCLGLGWIEIVDTEGKPIATNDDYRVGHDTRFRLASAGRRVKERRSNVTATTTRDAPTVIVRCSERFVELSCTGTKPIILKGLQSILIQAMLAERKSKRQSNKLLRDHLAIQGINERRDSIYDAEDSYATDNSESTEHSDMMSGEEALDTNLSISGENKFRDNVIEISGSNITGYSDGSPNMVALAHKLREKLRLICPEDSYRNINEGITVEGKGRMATIRFRLAWIKFDDWTGGRETDNSHARKRKRADE